MPAKPMWLLKIPDAVRQLEKLEREIITRSDVQTLFGVSKSQANNLMLRFGAERTSHLLTIPRSVLLDVLRKRSRSREFQQEEARREKLYGELRQARVSAVRYKVPTEVLSAKLRNLPEGVTVGGTRITVDYTEPKQALQRLYGLAQALGNDYERFETLVRDAQARP